MEHPADNPHQHHAPVIPRFTWLSLGFDRNAAEQMEIFTLNVQRIRESTSTRRRSCVLSPCPVTPNIETLNRRGLKSPPMPHHDSLLPHWAVIANYLRQAASVDEANPKQFRILSIYFLQLTSDVVRVIGPAIQPLKKHLKRLELHGNSLDSNGFQLVASFLSDNTHLKELSITDNEMHDLESVRTFSLAIGNHPSLETLVLENCGLGNSPLSLQLLLSNDCTVKKLRLMRNNIGSSGVKIVSDFLRNNPCVTWICLQKNILSDVDIAPLAEALKINTNLRALNFRANNFSEIGTEALRKIIYDGSSLEGIVESNHSCCFLLNLIDRRRHDFEHSQVSLLNYIRTISVGLKIRYKVFATICSMTNNEWKDNEQHFGLINLQTLDSVPTKLIPYLFKCMPKIQGGSDSNALFCCSVPERGNLLNMMYQTMRAWKKPQSRSMLDLRYLNNVPLRLVPRLLELIQKPVSFGHLRGHCNYSESQPQTHDACLGRIFNFIRAWKMPMLFEKRKCLAIARYCGKRKSPE